MNRRIQYLLLAHAALIKAFRPPARRLHRLVLRAAADADVNSLMTQLNAAVQQEDFRKAAELKKQLDALRGDDGATTTKTKGGDWASRGAPGWLQARLQDLGMRFPTPVQEAALDAVDGTSDVVVSAPTGSGSAQTARRATNYQRPPPLRPHPRTQHPAPNPRWASRPPPSS